MTRRPYGGQSRIAWATAVSAAQDRADLAGRMQQLLEDAGWDVTRLPAAHEVVVVLSMPGRPERRYAGPTTVDALRVAMSDVLNEGVEL